MIRRPPVSIRPYTLFPYTTLLRSAQALFLVLHDEVIGALGAVAVRLIVVGGVRPALVLVDGEIAVMHVLGFGREVDFLEQAGKFGKLGGAAIFFLEHRRIFAFHGISVRSEEHTSELQSLMRISYAVFCLKKKKIHTKYLNILY